MYELLLAPAEETRDEEVFQSQGPGPGQGQEVLSGGVLEGVQALLSSLWDVVAKTSVVAPTLAGKRDSNASAVGGGSVAACGLLATTVEEAVASRSRVPQSQTAQLECPIMQTCSCEEVVVQMCEISLYCQVVMLCIFLLLSVLNLMLLCRMMQLQRRCGLAVLLQQQMKERQVFRAVQRCTIARASIKYLLVQWVADVQYRETRQNSPGCIAGHIVSHSMRF